MAQVVSGDNITDRNAEPLSGLALKQCTACTDDGSLLCLRKGSHSVPCVFVAGIAFLRGFQVSLQALGGTNVACQLFLFHRNLSLPASHAEMVGRASHFLLFFCLLSALIKQNMFVCLLFSLAGVC